MAEKIHIGTINVVSNTKKIEIPSIPSLKFIDPFIHDFSSMNWKSGIVLLKEYQRKSERKKLANEEKIATRLEFCSTFIWEPLVIKIKKAPIKGINIIEDKIGKFI